MHRSIVACGVVAAALFAGASFAPQASAQWNNVLQPGSFGNGSGISPGWSGSWNAWLNQSAVGIAGGVVANEVLSGAASASSGGTVVNAWCGSEPPTARTVRVSAYGGMSGSVFVSTTGTASASGSSGTYGSTDVSEIGTVAIDGPNTLGEVLHDIGLDNTVLCGNVGPISGYSDGIWTVEYTAGGGNITQNGQGGSVSSFFHSVITGSPVYTTPSPTTEGEFSFSNSNSASVGGAAAAADGTGTCFADASSAVSGCIEWWE